LKMIWARETPLVETVALVVSERRNARLPETSEDTFLLMRY